MAAHIEQTMLAVMTYGLVLCCAACGDDVAASGDADASTCLAPLSLDCDPAYQPTFSKFFDNRLGVTCGAASTGGSCHAAAGGMAGLVLATEDDAYKGLLGIDGARRRVIPGDPECSLLVQRIESTDPDFVMPPQRKLSADERCAIVQWVANGAKR